MATFKDLLKMAVLKEQASNKDGHGKGRLQVLSYIPIYTYLMYICEITGVK